MAAATKTVVSLCRKAAKFRLVEESADSNSLDLKTSTKNMRRRRLMSFMSVALDDEVFSEKGIIVQKGTEADNGKQYQVEEELRR